MNKADKTRHTVTALFAAACWSAQAHGGFYLGAAAGEVEFEDIGELETACETAGVRCNSDDTDTGFKLFAGYQFGPFFAVETGYVDLGKLKAGVNVPIRAQADFETKGGFVSLLPQVPLGDIGSIYGRVGVAAIDAELTARVPSLGFDESDSGTVGAFTFGFGGALHFRQLTVRVEWERYSFDETFTIAGEDVDAPDLNLITGSVLIAF